MTVAIFTGSRSLRRTTETLNTLHGTLHHTDATFVGCCKTGLDLYAREILSEDAASFHVIKANWKAEGRSAGPKRNSRMVRAAAALAEALGVELVCHAWPLGESRGTRDCMRKAKAAGARVVVHTEAGES